MSLVVVKLIAKLLREFYRCCKRFKEVEIAGLSIPMSILALDLPFFESADMLGTVYNTDTMTFATQPRIF